MASFLRTLIPIDVYKGMALTGKYFIPLTLVNLFIAGVVRFMA